VFNKILVAVDGSRVARKSLEAAIDLAQRYRASLCALSVVQLPEYSAAIGEVKEAQEEGRKFFERILEEGAALAEEEGVTMETRVMFGHPAEVIIRVARQEKFDLIVIGYKGTSEIRKFLLGSVSDRVSDHAPCTVMLIK